MRVECIISSTEEPYAVLHINKITPSVSRIISLLEKEGAEENFIAAEKDGKTYFIDPENIDIVRTEGREIVCYDNSHSRYVLNKPLYELEKLLGNRFIRISKSAIINIRRISHAQAGFNGTMELVMKNGMEEYISRSCRKTFRERLGLE